MIVERGTHELSDGTWIEAGSIPVDGEWRKVHLEHEFVKPVVLTQISSQKVRKTYINRIRQVNTN